MILFPSVKLCHWKCCQMRVEVRYVLRNGQNVRWDQIIFDIDKGQGVILENLNTVDTPIVHCIDLQFSLVDHSYGQEY